jgi:hypothetical protein
MRRLATAAVGTVALTLALAAPASAKIWFQGMGGRTVHWDQRVTASIIGCSDSPDCGDMVGRHMVYVRRVGTKPLHRLGRIGSTGRVVFRVPHLKPGRYRLYAREGGQLFPVSEPFRIRRAG